MQYREIKKAGEKLAVLGYGCMRFPTKSMGSNSFLIDIERATSLVRYAIDHGVNYLDTAWMYHMGASESFLGEYVLGDGYREKVNIATKLPCYLIRKKEKFNEIFEKQLSKLRLDSIDYYLLHSLNASTFNRMVELGILEFMDEIKAMGKARYLGFSFHGPREDFIHIADSYNWDCTLVQFNILDEHYQAGIEGIRYAAAKGMGVFIMEPLRGGTLVGKIPEAVQKIYDEAPIKRSPADWALRWVLNHPEVTMVLSGMNDEAQIRQNLETASTALPNSLSAEEETIISRVRGAYDNLLTINCTGCGYCMPCPAGIDIPSALKDLNNAHMFNKHSAASRHMLMAGIQTSDGKPHWAGSCMDCAKCEKVCPQQLPIRENLQRVKRELEQPGLRAIARIARVFTP